jgi:hypothetical protein
MAGLPDLTAVRKYTNENGEIITYACEYLTSTAGSFNQLDDVVVPSYYDLVYNCSDDPVAIRESIASRLTQRAAERWGIEPSGETCDGIGVFVDNNALLAVSSEPSDSFASELSCEKLTPGNGECCIVVENKMTFTPYIPYTEFDFWAYVANELDTGATVYGNEDFRTAFIGSEIDTEAVDGKNSVKPVIAGVARDEQPSVEGGKFSVGGAVIFTGLALAMVGVLFLVMRRRSHGRKAIDINAAVSKSEPDLNDDVDSSSVIRPAYEVSVLSDDVNISYESQPAWSYQQDCEEPSYQQDCEEPDTDSEQKEPGCYAFDLGGSLRRDVLGAYGVSPKGHRHMQGPTTIEVVPPYPMEETSDSDADSWAQTDGTVGSLEERLDEVRGEI